MPLTLRQHNNNKNVMQHTRWRHHAGNPLLPSPRLMHVDSDAAVGMS